MWLGGPQTQSWGRLGPAEWRLALTDQRLEGVGLPAIHTHGHPEQMQRGWRVLVDAAI